MSVRRRPPARAARPTPTQTFLAGTELIKLGDATSFDEAEDRALRQRFEQGAEFAQAYLYIYEDKKLGKHVVGPSVDFVRQFVSQVINRGGRAHLEISEQPPIIEDVIIGGQSYVRAITCSIDRKTGERKWAVKEEARNNRHAATIALEKAERKALESHAAFDRKRVAKHIEQLLRKHRLDPKSFVIAGGARSSDWAVLFGRAKEHGIQPDQVRQAIREETGKGLSEVQTPQEAAAAAAVVDRLVDATPDATRAKCDEYTKQMGLKPETVGKIWEKLGAASAEKSPEDWRRLALVLELLSTGTALSKAVTAAIEKFPRPQEGAA